MSASKDKPILIEDKKGRQSKKKGLRDFVGNKYAVGSAVLLVIIVVLVVIALRPPKADSDAVAEDPGSDRMIPSSCRTRRKRRTRPSLPITRIRARAT